MKDILLKKTKQILLKRFKKFNLLPQTAIITGSGITLFRDKEAIFEAQYNDLPACSFSKKQKIKGHKGALQLFKINNKGILVFSGRRHLYQEFSFSDVTVNIQLAYKLGVKKIIITNAAGGINKNFKAGDLMLITGFIDLMQPTERGILNGITQPAYKIRTALTKKIFNSTKIKKGIYAGVLGPSYETYAEIKLLKLLEAHAVGMSTVPEIICAKSLGMDFAAISVISNIWDSKHKPSHKEVLEQVKKANEKLDDLISEVVK